MSIRARSREAFPGVFLTLVALVQAIALELLVVRAQGLEVIGQLNTESVATWLQIALGFVSAIQLWVATALWSIAGPVRIHVNDIIAPFFYGVAQFLAIGWIGPEFHPGFFYAIGVGYLVGAVVGRDYAARQQRDPENRLLADNPVTPVLFANGILGVLGLLCGVLVHAGVAGPVAIGGRLGALPAVTGSLIVA